MLPVKDGKLFSPRREERETVPTSASSRSSSNRIREEEPYPQTHLILRSPHERGAGCGRLPEAVVAAS
jgi:hypothetical protein